MENISLNSFLAFPNGMSFGPQKVIFSFQEHILQIALNFFVL